MFVPCVFAVAVRLCCSSWSGAHHVGEAFSESSSTLGRPNEILFFDLPPDPPSSGVASRAQEAASLNLAWAGALCLLFRFFAGSLIDVVDVNVSGLEVVLALFVSGSCGMAEVPALVMYASPNLWSPSLESNLAGKNMSGNFLGFGRWNA